jgi:hypothetical protein
MKLASRIESQAFAVGWETTNVELADRKILWVFSRICG